MGEVSFAEFGVIADEGFGVEVGDQEAGSGIVSDVSAVIEAIAVKVFSKILAVIFVNQGVFDGSLHSWGDAKFTKH